MRFSLQDVKKSVHRRAGELSVSLHFLRPGALHNEIQQLINYYEGLLGQPRRAFSLDDAQSCIGDYRLAHCLIATLNYWYSWQSPTWDEVLSALGEADSFAQWSSPAHLRLALYAYVNELYDGFLGAQERAQALQAFAELHHSSVPTLEYLLVLDSEAEALLTRLAASPPAVQEVAALYNQWVFEAALCNASEVRFVLDCKAFSDERADARRVTMGLGAAIKQLCYLARQMGVYYELAYEHPLLEGVPPDHLLLLLYGPQDVTGVPQQYGLRLARLCRQLLYPSSRIGTQAQKRSKLKTRAIVEAVATVHFLQRAYSFTIDTELLRLLPGVEQAEEQNTSEPSSLFDSGIEQAFATAFLALAAGHGTDGWRLEREPEPLLLEQGIFIADFALTRGRQRIYVEILGFWTPSYRERKMQKLQQLKGRNDLLLAIPLTAREAFAAIEADFPIVFYGEQIAVTDVLQILRHRYDDFAERLMLIDCPAIQEQVRRIGLLPENTCYQALHCYRRSELAGAVERVLAEDILFMPGVGLYHTAWLAQLKCTVLNWLRDRRMVTLSEMVQFAGEQGCFWPQSAQSTGGQPLWPGAAQEQSRNQILWDECTLEILLAHWPEIHIKRNSIFDITIELSEEVSASQEEIITSSPQLFKQESKKQVQERHTPWQRRKRVTAQTAMQGGLWDW